MSITELAIMLRRDLKVTFNSLGTNLWTCKLENAALCNPRGEQPAKKKDGYPTPEEAILGYIETVRGQFLNIDNGKGEEVQTIKVPETLTR